MRSYKPLPITSRHPSLVCDDVRRACDNDHDRVDELKARATSAAGPLEEANHSSGQISCSMQVIGGYAVGLDLLHEPEAEDGT